MATLTYDILIVQGDHRVGQAVEVFYPLSMRICNAVIVLVCTYARPSGAARRRTRECWTLKLRTVACVSHVGVGMVLTATLSHSLFTSSSSSRGARSRLQLLAILGSGRDLGQAISASCLWVLLCVPSWLTWQSYLPDASLPA